jgi:hypothetical protein
MIKMINIKPYDFSNSNNLTTDSIKTDMRHNGIYIECFLRDLETPLLFKTIFNIKQERLKEMYSKFNEKLKAK